MPSLPLLPLLFLMPSLLFAGVIIPPKRAHSAVLAEDIVDAELRRTALDTVVQHLDLPVDAMGTLEATSQELRKLVRDKPKWKYFQSIVKDPKCFDTFFFGNPKTLPSDDHPILYVYQYSSSDLIASSNDDLKTDVQCLDRLVSRTPFVEIVTCADSRIKKLPRCAGFVERTAIWSPSSHGLLLASYRHAKNADFAKRRLLYAALEYNQSALAEFLLSPSQMTFTPGKEHIAAALIGGNETLFFRLIQELESDTGSLVGMLHLNAQRDMGHVAIGDRYSHEHDPSEHLLSWLFTYLPFNEDHIRKAASRKSSTTLEFLITQLKSEMTPFQMNSLLISALQSIASSGSIDNIYLLVNEINSFHSLQPREKRALLSAIVWNRELAKKISNFDNFVNGRVSRINMTDAALQELETRAALVNIVSQKLGFTVSVETIIEALWKSRSLNEIFGLIRQCKWDHGDYLTIRRIDFEYVPRWLAERMMIAVRNEYYLRGF